MRLQEYSLDSLQTLVQTHPTVLIQFGTDWCAPCRKLERTLLELAAGSGELVVGKVNVEDWPDCAALHGVQRNPTLCLFRAGQLVGRHVGLLQPAELGRFLESG